MTTKYKTLLAEKIQANRKALCDWHARQAKAAPPPFYCSIDLRDSGYKIAPVDSNLFPAGFSQLLPHHPQQLFSLSSRGLNNANALLFQVGIVLFDLLSLFHQVLVLSGDASDVVLEHPVAQILASGPFHDRPAQDYHLL